MIKLYRKWLRESKEARTVGGRPMVVAAADYTHLPEVGVVVRNFTEASANDTTFDFSTPLENLSSFVLSELPYFEKGLPLLAPEEEISHYWDRLPTLAPTLEEEGFEEGIEVTTKYKDLAGESYETERVLSPLRFEGSGLGNSKGITYLVNTVENISEDGAGQNGRQKSMSGDGG
ncbi:MAG: hypothetical protein M3N45_06330 [Actinomycetota bacterium]|nr:hypothetical protein [Actinomycetota bacterium]